MLILLGGSFDPIHNGHLCIARHLQQLFPKAEVCFVPCKQPVIDKNLHISADDRVAMLQCAIKEINPKWRVDACELERETLSYTKETLGAFRTKHPERPIIFVMGSDVFAKLDQEWGKDWQSLIKDAHIIVIEREAKIKPVISSQLQQWLAQYETKDYKTLSLSRSGHVCRLNIQAPYVSSTAIRQTIATGQMPRDLMPEQVLAYICRKNLYIRPPAKVRKKGLR